MIAKITVLAIFLGLNWKQTVHGAAYSNVYIQSGPDVVPVQYFKYGPPPAVPSPNLAQLSSPPDGQVLPLPKIIPPCVIAPCILPGQFGGVSSVQPNAKIVAYNTPRIVATAVPSPAVPSTGVPPAVIKSVVVPTPDVSKDDSGYEYSYVVYDEITGDRKAQRELSDGTTVQGEYSFIQPDGYVREVKYTADDLTGFNAIVKNFLPESVPDIEDKSATKSDTAPPCADANKEAIKMEPQPANVIPVDATTQLEVRESSTESIPIQVSDVPIDTSELTVVPATAVAPPVDSVPSVLLTVKPDDNIETLEPGVQVALVNQDSHTENCPNEPHTHDNIQVLPTQEAATTTIPDSPIQNGLVSYNDIIKCIQAALLKRNNGGQSSFSPLTYILVPGFNKVC